MNDQPTKPKVGRIKRGRELIKSSWRVLMLDKELLTLPIIGFLASFAALIVGIALIGVTVLINASSVTPGSSSHLNWISYIPIAMLLVTIAYISNYIATAIARGALDRFEGKDPTVKGSLAAAKARSGSIFKFSVLTLTVGLILQMIQDRVPFAGKILTFLGKLLWGVATFFVIPIIAMSDKPVGPIDATKQSVGIIKRVWGESLVADIGIGLIALLTIIPYSLIGVVSTVMGASVAGALGAALGILFVLGFFGLILVFSVLSAIVRAAIYYWAVTGKTPETFNQELLKASFTPKKARKVFSA